MQNLKECGHERRGVMTEQNRSSLAILITGATIAYMVAQSIK
jgi:hypothetical protein